jgi:primary-amine oxidase
MSVTVAVTHPLDPLTGEEIATAVGVVRGTGDLQRPVFSLVVLVDPPKDVVVAFDPGDAIARRARVVATDRATRRTHEGIVDVVTGGLESWRVLDGMLPPIVDEDF